MRIAGLKVPRHPGGEFGISCALRCVAMSDLEDGEGTGVRWAVAVLPLRRPAVGYGEPGMRRGDAGGNTGPASGLIMGDE